MIFIALLVIAAVAVIALMPRAQPDQTRPRAARIAVTRPTPRSQSPFLKDRRDR